MNRLFLWGAIVFLMGCGGSEETSDEPSPIGFGIAETSKNPCQYLDCNQDPCAPMPKVDGAECTLPSGEAGYCLAGVCTECTGCDDWNECTLDACTAVGCSHYPYAAKQACTAGHCVINSYTTPDSALCVADGMCLDKDPITKVVAPVKVCSGGQECGFYSGQCGSF